MLPASKALCTGHRWFYVQEHTGGFRAHTTPPVPLSNITALVRLSNITALLPPPRTYLKSTGNCTVHKGTLRYIKMIREHTGMYKDVCKAQGYIFNKKNHIIETQDWSCMTLLNSSQNSTGYIQTGGFSPCTLYPDFYPPNRWRIY
jgi:hypothetical protein